MQNTPTTLHRSNMALTALTLLALLALSHGARLQRNDPRIVNGENAKPGEIPYQVSLQNKGSAFHFCGGSVLNEHFVITAAHCVTGSAASTQVVAGTIDLTTPHSVHDVVSIQVHEEYDQANSWINDIALLKVRTPFVRTQQISFVSLPSPGDVVNANDIAVVSGWGRLWAGGPSTTKLQRVNILIADQEYCRYMYSRKNYNIYNSQVCAFDPTAEKGSCHGDSGGPLTVDGKLTGLVSWAYGCASSEYPTVYTRVASHLTWIKEHAF